MRKPLYIVLSFALVITGWLSLIKFLPKPFESYWIEGIYERKEAAAQAIPGAKVVLIGGSSTHYSYRAAVISQWTGLSVVNLGTHAGLGADYILKRAERSLKPGDVAVVALEYHLLHALEPTEVLSRFVQTTDPSYLFKAPIEGVPELIFGYPPAEMLKQSVASTLPWNSPLYRAENVSTLGDETANTVGNTLPSMTARVAAASPIGYPATNPERIPQPLLDFSKWAKDQGVTLVMAWPVTVSRDVYRSDPYVRYFHDVAATFANAGFKVVPDPTPYFVPIEDMLDTVYHANELGADRASKALARDLCGLIPCPRQNLASR